MLTDADCASRPAGWIEGIVKRFTPETGMVIGFSPYEKPGSQDSDSGQAAGPRRTCPSPLSPPALRAGEYRRHATDRNLAYRKCVFDQRWAALKKSNHFASGDDDLFLKLVLRYTNWKIRYAFDAGLAVPTKVLSSVRQFFHQRMRHASKGLHYEPVKITRTACWCISIQPASAYAPWPGCFSAIWSLAFVNIGI